MMIRSKRGLKKYLRRKEHQLNSALQKFIDDFDRTIEVQTLEPTSSPASERQFRLLLKLRWLSYEFLWVRLKLHPMWRHKRWFLELFDVEEITINQTSVMLTGEIIWWAKGKDAVGEWWPSDHDPHRMGFHRIKLRGDPIDGDGKWVIEPMRVTLKLATTPKRVATYDLEFGYGSTYLRTTNVK
jgi:hypothetical protein